MTRVRATPYQATLRTTRSRTQVLDDLVALDVPDAVAGERATTYLVFTARRRMPYGPGRATAVALIIAFAVLLATATHVLWILLLPAAMLAYVPLLIGDQAMLAVGAVDDDVIGVTRLTVHGHVWGALEGAIDAYTSHLPAAPEAGTEVAPPSPGTPAATGSANTAA